MSPHAPHDPQNQTPTDRPTDEAPLITGPHDVPPEPFIDRALLGVLLVVIGAMALVGLLVIGGRGGDAPAASPTPLPSIVMPTSPPVAATATAVYPLAADARLRADSVGIDAAAPGYTPRAGERIVTLAATLTTHGTDVATLGLPRLGARLPNGAVVAPLPVPAAGPAFEPLPASGEGGGYVSFALPDSVTSFSLVVLGSELAVEVVVPEK